MFNAQNHIYRIAIIGAGAWGSALATVLSSNNHQVILWGRSPEVIQEIQMQRTNSRYLPSDIRIPEAVEATTDVALANAADIAVIAVPTQFIRAVLTQYQFTLRNKKVVINVSKGIEIGTTRRISEILQNDAMIELEQYVVLTGPSHAEEVSRKLPTSVVAASVDRQKAQLVQQLFSTPYFRVYTSHDVIGAELGGALKNVIALAAGIVDGIGLGSNTKAALMTRGLAEISRLGVAMGAHPLTFSGLSGLGDLIVTCISEFSRNRRLGELIGQGIPLEQAQHMITGVAEGVATAKAVKDLQQKFHVEMPISEQVYSILFQNKFPSEAIHELMTRDFKSEFWGIA